MDWEGGCTFKMIDFKGVFKESLQVLEMQRPNLNIFEGIYPRLDICKLNNNEHNVTNNSKYGYSGFERFFSSFYSPNKAFNFFDQSSSSSPFPSLSTPSSIPPRITSSSATPAPFQSLKEQTCLKYYNYCLVNANWTVINKQPCITTTIQNNNINETNNNRSVLISSLDFCPDPVSRTTIAPRENVTTKKYRYSVTAKPDTSPISLQTKEYNTNNYRNNENNTINNKNTEFNINNSTTSGDGIFINPRINATYEGITGKSNESSLASLIIIPIVVIIVALIILWKKKKQASKLKHKRMMVHRTESNTTATTIMTSYPQTPTSITDLINFHIDQSNGKNGGGEKSKKRKVKTVRQDSEHSNITSSGESISTPKQLDINELDQQQNELINATPNSSDKNLSEKFSTRSHLGSTNAILAGPPEGSGNLLVLGERLASEWDKRFNSIIDWMNRSEMGLNQSDT